jgi:hypothetical protein
MVNTPPISSLRLSITSSVMTPAILVMETFCAASILYVPFLVLLDILPSLVEAGAGEFLLLFSLCFRWRALAISYYLLFYWLNQWLTLKLMIRIITNYETVYLLIGLMPRVFFLDSPLFRDYGK